MDTSRVGKLWNDLQDSAREFAGFGLQSASRALGFAEKTLSSLKGELEKSAEKLTKNQEEGTSPGGEAPKP